VAGKEQFQGFGPECFRFFEDLTVNNNKQWFQDHKNQYERFVLAPARDFVTLMGERIREIAPGIIADPRIDKSIFRIYRDTRFSKDKTPYKDHLGIFLWEGQLPKMESSGFYFHLQPPMLMLGVGIHSFSKRLLEVYRDAVVDPRMGPELVQAVNQVKGLGDYEIGGLRYKRTPRGYDPKGPNAEFLLYDGLWASWTSNAGQEVLSKEIEDFCFEKFKDMAPVHYWLKEMTDQVAAKK
jgi:uncharacterized protein (TIGR02453 family)